MAKNFIESTRKRKGVSALINGNIEFKRVRLIGADGAAVGVVGIEDAIAAAEDAELDLVVVSEESDPPVCKILDYGKYRYEQQKKKVESKKKQKIINIKEVQLRPSIGGNDLLVKCKAIKKFIENGDKVKVILRYRGREISRQETGREVIQKIRDFCSDFAKEEILPKLEGSVIIMVLASK